MNTKTASGILHDASSEIENSKGATRGFLGLQKRESVWRLVMPSLHTLAAAETTFGRAYVHMVSTRMSGRARIDTFESTESGYSAEISSRANRVCINRSYTTVLVALRRRMQRS